MTFDRFIAIALPIYFVVALIDDLRADNAPMAALMGFALGVHFTVLYVIHVRKQARR